MKILGIETSCDETSIAIISTNGKKIEVLSNTVSSQIKLHAKWGGVVPHLASREHAKNLDWVLKVALEDAKLKITDIDLIAVTSGPGLIASLIIGTMFARSLAWKYDIPILPINHMEGHIYSNWLSDIPSDKKIFPALCLTVSGGHTQLILMTGHGKHKLIGETLDDAAGEAFDKIARILGLGYPGGPIISKYAELGDPTSFNLPRPILKSKDYNFSFSGLKTAVLYLVRDLVASKGKLTLRDKRNIAASAQQAIIDVLIAKTLRAAHEHKVKSILLSGGVSASKELRETLVLEGGKAKVTVVIPGMSYTTDNAAMIAVAGYYNWLRKSKTRPDNLSRSVGLKSTKMWQKVLPDANWEIV